MGATGPIAGIIFGRISGHPKYRFELPLLAGSNRWVVPLGTTV